MQMNNMIKNRNFEASQNGLSARMNLKTQYRNTVNQTSNDWNLRREEIEAHVLVK